MASSSSSRVSSAYTVAAKHTLPAYNAWASPSSRQPERSRLNLYEPDSRYPAAHHHASTYQHQHNYPSPATSTTSTGSSLRTPPDLLLSSTQLGAAWKPMNAAPKPLPPRYMAIDDMERRLKLLDTLPRDMVDSSLPSPPASPKPRQRAHLLDIPQHDPIYSTSRHRGSDERGESSRASYDAKANGSSSSRKRKSESQSTRNYDSDDDDGRRDNDASSSRRKPSPPAKRSRQDSPPPPLPKSNGHTAMDVDPSPPTALPAPREWTKAQWVETAASYASLARHLKHQGDQRLREASTLSLTQGPSSAASLAALEQTDAVLLFCYGFWCEDQALGKPNACIAHNWASIFGLLKYVRGCHERNGAKVLAGFCRLLEALVLRRLCDHEQRQLQERMTQLAARTAHAASASSSSAAGSPPSNVEITAPSPASVQSSTQDAGHLANAQDVATALADVTRAMAKLQADSERSTKLFVQARIALANSTLRSQFPGVWAASIESDLDPLRDSVRLNPAMATSSLADDPGEARWAWPVEHVTPLPHVVNFGRALLREAAASDRLAFRLGRVTPKPVVK